MKDNAEAATASGTPELSKSFVKVLAVWWAICWRMFAVLLVLAVLQGVIETLFSLSPRASAELTRLISYSIIPIHFWAVWRVLNRDLTGVRLSLQPPEHSKPLPLLLRLPCWAAKKLTGRADDVAPQDKPQEEKNKSDIQNPKSKL